jgi:uncharacterized protein YndB with AHSA1/START domain
VAGVQDDREESMVDIAHRVGIRASSEVVYKALATREGVAGWWTEDTEAMPSEGGDGGEVGVVGPGGTLRMRFTSGGVVMGEMTMRVDESSPSERVVWTVVGGPEEWMGTTVRFELEQQGEFCIVLFSHEGWQKRIPFMHHCSTKWATFLLSLKALVETGRGRPSPGDVKIDNWN